MTPNAYLSWSDFLFSTVSGTVCVLTRTFKSTPLGLSLQSSKPAKKTLKESVLEKLPQRATERFISGGFFRPS